MKLTQVFPMRFLKKRKMKTILKINKKSRQDKQVENKLKRATFTQDL